MNIKKETMILRDFLDLTQKELADELNVSFETINRWERGKYDIDEDVILKLYDYAFRNKIYFNSLFEQLYKDLYQTNDTKILFHGSKTYLDFPLDLNHSKENNDFGKGFYLGESFSQGATYIAKLNTSKVYCFTLDLSNLKILKFSVDQERMLAICYFRGWLKDYKDSPLIKKIVKKVEEADVIIAPIGNNKMFDIIFSFVNQEITTLQAQYGLSASYLGDQYCVRTKKGLEKLNFIKTFYVSNLEKKEIFDMRIKDTLASLSKVKVAKRDFMGKGQYIDQLLK